MKIKKVEIEGFRAYRFKDDGTFDFTNKDDIPSNFVAIYAPNGFGKSSFYDAVEWAITHNLDRFAGEYNKKITSKLLGVQKRMVLLRKYCVIKMYQTIFLPV